MNFINNSDYFDQHFLDNDDIINRFIEISKLKYDDVVVEVGPGKGNITKKIAPLVKKIYCIELDTRLKPFLDELCTKYKNIEVIYDSALNVQIPNCNKIITSLPYSIIEPFMYKMIRSNFQELIMITGNKFAKNVEEKKINKLSLMVNCFFSMDKIMQISPNNFNPAPRVMSAMIKLKKKKHIENDIYGFFRTMYLLDNKKIKNSLIESIISIGWCSTKRKAKEIINELNIPNEILETKFEVCSNKQLLKLYNCVGELLNEKNRFRIGR